MEKLKILKEYLKENKQKFRDMSKDIGVNSEFYIACLYSNFIRNFLATESLEFAERCLKQDKERPIVQNDSFYYPSDIDDISTYQISCYYFDELKLSPQEALEKYVSSVGGYAYHGFSNHRYNTITKEGLKINHTTEERDEIDALPEEVKNNPYFFRYYFLDSKNSINLASQPRVAYLFANSGMPEWFKMFCTGEMYPYDEFLRAKMYEPINKRIKEECRNLSKRDKNQVLKFFNKYWDRYVKNAEEADNMIAVIKTDNYLKDQVKKTASTKEEFFDIVRDLEFNNIVIQRDVDISEMCILEVAKPVVEKKINFDTEFSYLENT